MVVDEVVEGGYQVFGSYEVGGGDVQFVDQFFVQVFGGIVCFIGQCDDVCVVGIEVLVGFGQVEFVGGLVQQGGIEDGFECIDVLVD